MALPPLNPIKDADGKQISYFEKLIKYSVEYLRPYGIVPNFKGYTATILEYANLKEEETDKAWKLAKELNAWSEYFSSIANLIQKLYLDSDTDKLEIQAIASYEADANKVANGDRLSNKDKKVVEARKRRNTLKALYDELDAKVKFLERAYYHCKATCDWANKTQGVNNNTVQQ